MATVIINEFEIVPEPEPTAPTEVATTAKADESPVPGPDEIVRIQQLAWHRRQRTWAN
jgi:hypothetical protein